ncbi:MAG: NAD(P)-dependent dehydrogenase (short-subunit alcohol dehydrogenase family) [Alphaproteobacteria bacterium]|jgi:NAD(P)-dependent dehydrogenase (short-subunit alcohol dehydrogenase family)
MDLPQTPSFRLDGRRALVTGASSGLGLACAAALADAGAHVILAARGREKLEAVAAAITQAGGSTETLVMDVADINAMRDQLKPLGGLDVLINSAGTARHTSALETTQEDYDAVTDTNVKGAYFLSVGVAHGMIDAGIKGSIINVSSQMGHIGGIERAVYCGTKHAVEGFTKAMAIEFGPKGIRVNTLAPTFIRTPLAEQTLSIPERKAWIESKIKLGRIGELSDIMGPAVFLASDASALITGTSLLVDGGWTAG